MARGALPTYYIWKGSAAEPHLRAQLDRDTCAADTGRAMSQENVEVVRRVTDVMDAEGFEAALPIFLKAAHPDVEWREDPTWPGSATYRGIEQVRRVIVDRMGTLDFH
jgi:hypothetical protein